MHYRPVGLVEVSEIYWSAFSLIDSDWENFLGIFFFCLLFPFFLSKPTTMIGSLVNQGEYVGGRKLYGFIV